MRHLLLALFAVVAFVAASTAPAASAPQNPVFDSVTITLTPAQILALDTTPVQIVPAQGVGTVIAPLETVAHGKPGVTPFNYAGGGSIQLTHGSLIGLPSVGIEVYPLGDASGGVGLLLHDSYAHNGQLFDASANVVSFGTSAVENQPLMLKAYYGTAPTQGDGTIKITVIFAVVKL